MHKTVKPLEKPISQMDNIELVQFIQDAGTMGAWFENLARHSTGRHAIDNRVRAGSWWYRRNCAVQELDRRKCKNGLGWLPY